MIRDKTEKTMKQFAFVLFIWMSQMSSGTLSLPDGFVHIHEIDPTILLHPFYYGTHNFMGRQIDGYKAPTIIVTKEAALALKNVQADIRKDNYSLLITDGYRPTKAVDHFVRWSKDLSDQKMKQYYYPHIDKRDAFKLGYVAEKSGHSRGSTVDLTIIEIGKTYIPDPPAIKRTLTNGKSVYRWLDNTVDMYTSVDLMDLASWHDTDLVTGTYARNRNYLREKMVAHNFQPFNQEWWHYTLIDEPFNNTYFNFDVE